MPAYDSIIIGGGHNGLVCASMLARAGKKVLLLESSDSVGGMAAHHEFHPGFSAPVAHTASHFPASIASKLGLESHGLDFDASGTSLLSLSRGGRHVSLNSGQLEGASEADKDAFGSYQEQMRRFANALEPFWLKTIPRIGPGGLADLMTFGHIGLKLRRMGKDPMREFLRVFSLPMRDLMDENFESETVKTLLSWDGMIGSRLAPRSPNNAVLTLLYRMSGDSHSFPVTALVSALEASANQAGVEVRTGSPVSGICVKGDLDGLAVKGVELEDGTVIEASQVISSLDPKTTFIDLLGVQNLEIGFTNRINRIRCKGLVAKLHLALDEMPTFSGLDTPGDRMIIAPELDSIEFAFDDSKYGEFSKNPVLEISIPTMRNEGLAPKGKHVLSAHVMFVPGEIKGGWTDSARDELGERAISTIEEYAPGIRQSILGSEVLTPADIESRHGVSGGHWHHGEMALDQALMMRPTYEAAQYATPVPGLYLCGAGCHPGGDLTGAAGYNAAREILK